MEEIPESSSKAEYRNVEFIEYYSGKNKLTNSSWIGKGNHLDFSSKDKLTSIINRSNRQLAKRQNTLNTR